MNSQIERTGLWTISLGSKSADEEFEEKKERIRSVLRCFRNHVSTLTSRIASTFPQLTIHDVTHLDALWETADLIAGPGYPLNPLEAFVLGGAILLHDAAHCFEAYEGGLNAVRGTLAWRDAYAAELVKNSGESVDKLEQYCDFTAIRLLHARQAEKLGDLEWKSENGIPSFFLIEDTDLRSRYGALIGKIAASHNWSIDDVNSQLRNQVNAPGGWPADWRVDPIKIACLLRCADAAHLDDRRAPDFLFSLIRRSGVSLDHWKAQNWLARVDKDQSDPTGCSLLFTSNRTFKPADATAWWVAYDAVAVLDAEIKASNNLLSARVQKDKGSPAFKMQKVTGANSPIELTKTIETEGWIPTSAKIHVGNLEKLVKTLGGQNLYGGGDNFAIVIRELIQNARDAIAARKAITQYFSGRILVKITRKNNTQTFVEICDNGIGMSERTMVGPLLDFGTSFWATDLVQSEFPGLRSSSFKPVGKFGIGFYAVFMVAIEVLVASRRFDEGISDVTNLLFPDGLTLRPILAKGGGGNYDTAWSTSVRITINEPIDCVRCQLINKGSTNELQVPIQNYLAAVTTGLDVSVELQMESDTPVIVHENITDLSTPEKLFNWIKNITFIDVPGAHINSQAAEYVRSNYQRIKNIMHEGRLVGYAALLDIPLTPSLQHLTTDTIGGLTNYIARGTSGYMGYMDNSPATAKRDAAQRVVPANILQTWANEQISILKEKNPTPEQFYWMASNLSELDLDPIAIINFPVIVPPGEYKLLSFDELFEILQRTSIASLINSQVGFAETNVQPMFINNLPTLRPLTAGSLIRFNVENEQPKYPFSLLGCLARLIKQQGRYLIYEVKPNIIMDAFYGPMDAMIIKLNDV